jgi:hypothetical protein
VRGVPASLTATEVGRLPTGRSIPAHAALAWDRVTPARTPVAPGWLAGPSSSSPPDRSTPSYARVVRPWMFLTGTPALSLYLIHLLSTTQIV